MASLILAFLGMYPSREALAKDEVFKITIKDHQFSPNELVIPANQKIKIIIENQDSTPEEFESYELNREKVIVGHSQINLFIGPLKPDTAPPKQYLE